MNIKALFCFLAILSFPVTVAAGEYFNTGFGVVLKSYHFTNSFKHAKIFNENNVGPTFYLSDTNNIIPLIDEVTVSYVHKNSYDSNSVYLFFYKGIFSRKNFKLDFSVGAATGYEKHLIIARDLGFMPLAGFRMTFFNHMELGLLPTGIVAEKGANVLTFSYKF
jgi:hypothetical protein